MTTQERLHHQKEIADAIQRGATTYTIDRASILLPTPQVCGTMTQQRTYAMDKAMEMLNAMDM